MESQPILAHQFYSELNQFIGDYQQEPKEAKLDCIYALMQEHLQKTDASSDIQELNQIRVKLAGSQVEENNKIMQLIHKRLNLPQQKHQKIEYQKRKWDHIFPKEIWKEILTYLGEDLTKIPQLSKQFYELFQEPQMQAQIVERCVNKLSAQQIIERCQSCGTFVKKLNLGHLKDLTNEQLAFLFKACPHLQELNLQGCEQITREVLLPRSGWKRFKKLKLALGHTRSRERLLSDIQELNQKKLKLMSSNHG